ncbi:MAG: carbohydrate ABC transporter substrate-binding protein [Anaerolineae bacterium]|nr:carbohydrate ABC transporter substrate-binding protein [Anaerolineae bacterium]
MSKRLVTLAIAAVLVLVTVAPTFAQDGLSGELEIFSWWAGDEGPALEALIAKYNEMYPDVTVENATVTGGSGVNARAVLKTRMLGGDPPDAFQVHAGQELIGTWVVAERMEDLTFLYEEEGWMDKFPQGLLDLLSADGGIWSVPVNIHRSNVMWYVPAKLEELGIEAPATWDDFLAVCPTIQEAGLVPLAVAENWTVNHLWESVALAELGVDGWNSLWTGEKAWTDDDVVAMWDKFGQILDCSNIDVDAATLSWQQATDMVINGDAVFNVMGDWAAGYMATTLGLEPGVGFGWAAAPGTAGVFMMLSDSFGLPKDIKNRDNSLAWLKLLGSQEGQDIFNPLKGSIAGRLDSDLSLYNAYLQSAAADWQSNVVVGSLAHGAVAPESFSSEFGTVMEIFLGSRSGIAAANASQAIANQAGIGK